MRLEILKKFRNCRILMTDGVTSYAAVGNRFYTMNAGGNFALQGVVGKRVEQLLALHRIPRQFLRLGIHHLLRLPDGKFLVIIRKRVYLMDPLEEPQLVLRIERGNKPTSKGVCLAPNGDIFLGEYAVNGPRTLPMLLHRSRDGGRSFQTIYEFKPGEIAHYHFIQWDHYENCLWMGTGDFDRECLLFKSVDGGDRWEKIGGGSQLWRAVGLAFRPEGVYWGTDAGWTAGKHLNYVMRLDRKTGAIEKVHEMQGPCHGNATLRDGTLVITTGVERGENETDSFAHVWASRDGNSWEELIRFKKDFWHRTLQFGVIRFPVGIENSDNLLFTCMGLVGNGETSYAAKIIHD